MPALLGQCFLKKGRVSKRDGLPTEAAHVDFDGYQWHVDDESEDEKIRHVLPDVRDEVTAPLAEEG